MNTEEPRFVVKMTKVTNPDGEKQTRSVVLFDISDQSYFPNSDVINKVLPKIDAEYRELIKRFHEEGSENFHKALENFFCNVSKFVIVGEGLREALSEDIRVDIETIKRAFVNTSWFQQLIEYIRREVRKGRKEDAVKYAESIRQLVELFGLGDALDLLNRNDINIKRTAVVALCRVATETPRIKRLVQEGKLKLTIAWELPRLDGPEREKIAEELVSKSYAEAKRYLKKVKMSLS